MHWRTDESLVVALFNNTEHSVEDMAVMGIDQLHSLDPTLQKMKDSRWIRDLRTTFSPGVNLRVNSL